MGGERGRDGMVDIAGWKGRVCGGRGGKEDIDGRKRDGGEGTMAEGEGTGAGGKENMAVGKRDGGEERGKREGGMG